ncbi:MAG: agmatine deiminase family protein [Xanthomonadales bacterium]|jgi:agmatine/peptidylarginine deiminase|nr:agmatine deiminase family protein [Xanthomonadales bacterium]
MRLPKLFALLLLLLALPVAAEEILPRDYSPAERELLRELPPLLPRGASPPPTGVVRAAAEYEPNEGILVRWTAGQAALTEMIVKATTLDARAKVWIVVNNATTQNSATTTLTTAGANLSRVVWITAPSDSIWMRDYGPRFVYQNGRRVQIDHTYNRVTRPNDNAIPTVISNLFGEPLYDTGLIHGGGNYHLFDDGPAYMTDLIVAENPGLSAADVIQRYRDFQGVDQRITGAFPASFDSTQHIDMWTLPAGPRTIIIGRYDPSAGVPHTVSEALAADKSAAGYTVIRTPGFRVNNTHFTYTNAVILNNLVLTCRFNNRPTENAQAIAAFQQAFPGRTIDSVDCTNIITLSGAIHCIVMHVPVAVDPQDMIFVSRFED